MEKARRELGRMSLKNCERCGRLFLGVELVCPACLEKEQEEFQQVRDYLREHPDAAVLEVSAATGVQVERLRRWAREGRLQLKPSDAEGTLRCQRCGAPIESGRLCPRCVAHLAAAARRAASSSRPSPAPAVEAEGTGKGPGKAEGQDEGAGEKPPEEKGSSDAPPAGKLRPRVHTIDDIRRRFR